MFLSCLVGFPTFPTYREINFSSMQIAELPFSVFSVVGEKALTNMSTKKDSTSDSKPLMLFSLILQGSIIPACSEYLPDHPLAHSHEKLRGIQKRASNASLVHFLED